MNKQIILTALITLALCIGLLSSCQNGSTNSYSTTVNGFQYVHHIENNGAKPQPGEYAYFNIDIFVDDSLIQTSRDNPIDTPLVQVPDLEKAKLQPNPIIDVLPLMSIGDSVTINQPLDSLPQRPPGFDEYEMLYYNVALIDIKNEEEFKVIAEEKNRIQQEKMAAIKNRLEEVTTFSNQVLADYNASKLNDKLVETESGLKYIIHEEGTGEIPNAGEPIKVHYYGMLTNGSEFDNSFKRGQPHTFELGKGQVIKGWDEGLSIFKKGTKGTLFIPYQLAYGENGRPPSIPAKSELVFYVELLNPKK